MKKKITSEEYGILEKKVMELLQKRKPLEFKFGKRIKLGVAGDLHLGNIYSHQELLGPYYKLFKKEGCEFVLNPGDIVDGEKIYRGQEYDLFCHGADKQVDLAVKMIPKNLDTYLILGNHDLSFYRNSGIDIGSELERKTKNLIYLGQEEADIKVNGIVIRLSHPGGGTAYAISYKIQKYIDSLSGGLKPNLLIVGNYHKAEFLPCYRNIFTVQSGTLQSQTSYMRRKNLAAHIGIWILDITTNKSGIAKLKAEFIPYYEKAKVKYIY